MDDFEVEAVLSSAVLDLEEAAGVGGGDGGDASGLDFGDFAIQKLAGHFGLNEVVDASAAAAPGTFGKFHEIEAGDGAEKLAWLSCNFLAVAKVAGFVISDGGFRLVDLGFVDANDGKPFVDVFDFVVPFFGSGVPFGIIF